MIGLGGTSNVLSVGALAAVFLVDAAFFPVGPELPFVILVSSERSWWFGPGAVAASVVGEVLGTAVLYFLTGRGQGKAFRSLERALVGYLDLIRTAKPTAILWNRVVPVVPFMGAVIRMRAWALVPSLLLVAAGGLLKYGAIAILVRGAGLYFPHRAVTTFSLSAAVAWIVFNLGRQVLVRYRRRSAGLPS